MGTSAFFYTERFPKWIDPIVDQIPSAAIALLCILVGRCSEMPTMCTPSCAKMCWSCEDTLDLDHRVASFGERPLGRRKIVVTGVAVEVTILVISLWLQTRKSLYSKVLRRRPCMASVLLSLSFEQRNLSTSSFRPPGGPTPARGFFLPREAAHRL
jgi:hypothetical protein